MSVTEARPDLAAHTHAMRASFPEVATELRELLGGRFVRISAASGKRARWSAVDDGRQPSAEVQQRLRLALQVALPIAEADGKEIAQAWFQGLNPQLDDRSPARMLRDGDFDEAGPAVVGAARAFLAGG